MPERLVGHTLGQRYRLTRLIGSGAYAWVYEAYDAELELAVAVKVLRPEHTGNATSEARFRREATTAARLRHPNIVTIRDVGRSDDATWVVMDLLPGALARRLQVSDALPEPEAVRLGLDVAAALAAAHTAGVIHRDVKPDNILFGASGEAVVCDFGLARALEGGADLSATNQVVGTPHYFSPEQARGESLDGRSDLYALGVTLFRVATGRLPFEGTDWYAVARQHIDNDAPDPRSIAPHLSPGFAAIISRLLAKRPEQRYATALDLASALAALPTAPASGTAWIAGAAATTSVTPALARGDNRRVRLAAGSAVGIATLALLLWLLGAAERVDARLAADRLARRHRPRQSARRHAPPAHRLDPGRQHTGATTGGREDRLPRHPRFRRRRGAPRWSAPRSTAAHRGETAGWSPRDYRATHQWPRTRGLSRPLPSARTPSWCAAANAASTSSPSNAARACCSASRRAMRASP
ncbi:MAG: serine/threonine protein kinase [Gemmatimonadaceae bacterium]|nr:serine/threonine protein kinase [Gemmatimonadaceae bacterium]